MRKLIALLLVIFLVGCAAPEAPAPEPEVAEAPAEEVTETVKEVPAAPTEIISEPEPEEELSPELKSLLGKADEKIKNIPGKAGGYEFLYAPPPENLARDNWHIKGNKIVINLYEENVVQSDLNYDTIYLDTKIKDIVAYCEDERSPRCPDADKKHYPGYDESMIKTPYQWVKEIKSGEIVGSEMLWDRKVEIVEYMVDGTTYKQWVDGFSGLPVKVRIYEPGKDPVEYQFRDLAVNSVTDDILEH